jgi:pimeloyl-ACP methyl ester carboxylesterase
MSTVFVTARDGARIAYDVVGEGPALMLLHGAGKSRVDWRKLGYIDRLVDGYTVINVDIRGSGDSDPLTQIEDYTIEKICNDLEVVAEACNVGDLRVWGHSFGGSIARYLGANSGRVKAIAVIGAPFGPAVDADFDRYIDEFIDKYGALARAYSNGEMDAKKRKSAIKGRIPVWVACFQAMRAWPAVAPGDLNCPALLLAGTKNKSVMNWLRENQYAVAAADLQVEIIDGLTHPQEFSKIDLVYPVVRAFLDRV